MNYKIRMCKTKKGMREVQIIYFHKRKTIVAKHLGTAKEVDDVEHLREDGQRWIENEMNNYGLFSQNKDEDNLSKYEYLGFKYFYAYEFLSKIFEKFNFHKYLSKHFKDLIIARILEPSSKKASVEFLSEFLNIDHSLEYIYQKLSVYKDSIKNQLEKEIIQIAKQEFKFNFNFVLYDVTTLYFEAFEEDEFRKNGFSKEHKNGQPQVVVGLIVTPDGFPLSYEVFKGNTFEGNTFLPILKAFKELHQVDNFTIVADSAMFAKINFDTLKENNLNYIVGSKLSNLKKDIFKEIISKMKQEDGFSVRVKDLIVDYSLKRHYKDEKDLKKQVEKANKYVNSETLQNPRIKYLKTENLKNSLNQDLIDKNTKLFGLKGYTSNLTLPNQEIIKYYHNLYKVEHAWRIAKSDLEARPIYHFKENSIRNHILICYLSLTISVYLELKNHLSIDQIVHSLKSITSAKLQNTENGNVIYKRVPIGKSIKEMERVSYEC